MWGAEVWLHSFLTLTLGGQLHVPAALLPENNPRTHWAPERVWLIFRILSCLCRHSARIPVPTPTALCWLKTGENRNFVLTGLQMKHAAKRGVWVLQHRVQPRKIVTELASPDTH